MQPKRAQVLVGQKLSPTGFGHLEFSSAGTAWSGFLLEEHSAPESGVAHEWSWLKPHLTLHTEGRSRLRYRENGEVHERMLETGTISILPKGYDLSFSWEGAVRFLVIELDSKVVERFYTPEDPPIEKGLVPRHGLHDPPLAALMRNIEAETKAGCPTGRLYGESISLALAAYVANRYSADRPLPENPPQLASSLSRAQYQRLVDYIHSNLDKDLGLTELSGLLDLSPNYFCRLFRNTFGVSPHQYVMHQRVDAAKRLLAERRIEIVEIATTLGFATQSHFTEVFRRFTGTTPRRFRLQC